MLSKSNTSSQIEVFMCAVTGQSLHLTVCSSNILTQTDINKWRKSEIEIMGKENEKNAKKKSKISYAVDERLARSQMSRISAQFSSVVISSVAFSEKKNI